MWWLLIALGAAGLYLLIRGFFVEPRALRCERVEVTLTGEGGRLEPARTWRLLHLTDLHLRSEPAYEECLLALARAARPDVTLLTGDYIDDDAHLPALARVARVARGLAALAPVVAVLGDNDLEEGADRTAATEQVLVKAGVTLLRGTVVALADVGLFVGGIDDPRWAQTSIKVLGDEVRRDAPFVLLSHSAEVMREAEQAGVDLLLSGHTHGGQVCLPGGRAIITNDRLGPRYAAGLHRYGRMHIYVGRGVGWAKLRVRLFCPPEMTLITLRAGSVR